MLYKEYPYHHVYMLRKASESNYPKERDGFKVVPYQAGMMKDWCRVQVESGHIETMEVARNVFEETYLSSSLSLSERLFFVVHISGEVVGSITLWEDMIHDVVVQRLHWLAIKDTYAKQGLASYLIEMICAICKEDMYLSTQTWSFPAVHLYVKYGFQPWNPYHEEDYETAWSILERAMTT